MSVANAKLILEGRKTMKLVCVFCMNIWESGTIVCPDCREYKGLMPLNRETLDYLDEDPEEWKEYL